MRGSKSYSMFGSGWLLLEPQFIGNSDDTFEPWAHTGFGATDGGSEPVGKADIKCIGSCDFFRSDIITLFPTIMDRWSPRKGGSLPYPY